MITNDSTVNQIKKRIEEHGKPNSITELCLDEIEIKEFTP
jgi:hypothetical protein